MGLGELGECESCFNSVMWCSVGGYHELGHDENCGKYKKIILNTTISERLDKFLREVAVAKFGNKKGALQKALTEAIHDWILEYRKAQLITTKVKQK